MFSGIGNAIHVIVFVVSGTGNGTNVMFSYPGIGNTVNVMVVVSPAQETL